MAVAADQPGSPAFPEPAPPRAKHTKQPPYVTVVPGEGAHGCGRRAARCSWRASRVSGSVGHGSDMLGPDPRAYLVTDAKRPPRRCLSLARDDLSRPLPKFPSKQKLQRGKGEWKTLLFSRVFFG
jgi:hypothetical protein